MEEYVGSIVYVEPATDHVGGYGELIYVEGDMALVTFKEVLTEEVKTSEISIVC